MRSAILILVVLAIACESRNSSSSPTGPTSSAPVPGIDRVFITGDPWVFLGESAQFEARAILSGGQDVAIEKASWTSSSPATAGVDSKGRVTGHANGLATLVVTIAGVTGQLTIQVLPDARGVWKGSSTMLDCRSFWCVGPGYSWPGELRFGQVGAAVTGLLFDRYYFYDPDSAHISGLIESDGVLHVQGTTDAAGRPGRWIITDWQSRVEPDGVTMTGSYSLGTRSGPPEARVGFRFGPSEGSLDRLR